MVSKLELNYRYDKYLQIFKDQNVISIGGEGVDFPMKRSMNSDDMNVDIREMSINDSDKLLLSHNSGSPSIRHLPPHLLKWLAVKLTEVLKTNYCKDQTEYWWFTYEYSKAHSEYYDLFPKGLIDNFELLIRLVLADPIGKMGGKPNKILSESKTLASYLAFPTLEGFAKIACRYDINMDGEIKDGKKIRELTSDPRRYEYQTSEDDNDICSNLGQLLWHLETVVSSPQNRILYKEMRRATGDLFDISEDEIYGYFNDQRNNSLHGRSRARQEYGAMLNYICLVIWATLLP